MPPFGIEELKGLNSTLNDLIIPKISIMPHGVDLEKFYSKEKPSKLTFILNKGFKNLEDRGGVQYFLKAYLEEFNKSDNVEALIKLNPAYGIPNLDNMIKLITKKDQKDCPKLAFDVNAYDYKDLVQLYNKGNVFVSPTRAEAYNLGCIEACACGLPVITTNFGGQTDFINESNGWIIPGILEEIKHEILYEGIKWLTPDVEELRKVMRDIYNHPEQIKNKSDTARKTAQENTWNQTAEKIKKLI
jgi:glycosyltransferase involved in cell wall biosynthesis